MKINLVSLMRALYAPCDESFCCDADSGEAILCGNGGEGSDEEKQLSPLSLPHYSPAYERRRFLGALCPDETQRRALMERFGFSDAAFAQERSQAQDAWEASWSAACREMFEALNIEKKFQDFFFCVSLSKALLWCAENGYEKDASGIDKPFLLYYRTYSKGLDWDAWKAEYHKFFSDR